MPTGINPGDNATATSTAGAATVNHTGGIITTESLTTAAGADYSFTLTNSLLDAKSVLLISIANGTNTTVPVYAHNINPTYGSATFLVRNAHASAALNGTLVISFVVL
jgi:hypothetical protein